MKGTRQPSSLMAKVRVGLSHAKAQPYCTHDLLGKALPLQSIHQKLRQLLQPLTLLNCTADDSSGESLLLRISLPIAPIDPLSWLQAQPTVKQACYWSNRSHTHQIAGLGVAEEYTCHDPSRPLPHRLLEKLEKAPPNIRYFGGCRFDPKRVEGPEWQGFGAAWWILPRLCIERSEHSRLILHLSLRSTQPTSAAVEELLEQVEALRWNAPPTEPDTLALKERTDHPDLSRWTEMIGAAKHQFAQTSMAKVVLARRSQFERAASGLSWLSALREESHDTYLFYFQPSPNLAFFGASPERLYQREARMLCSEALAGTRSRDPKEASDKALTKALLQSPKDRIEQSYVADGLQERFQRLCVEVHREGSPSIRKLRHVQHLCSRIHGHLHPQHTDGDVLRTLHPTPAVGGSPTAAALDAIRRLEPFDRGWYAGPVGWISATRSEFAVAIRSALVSGNHINLYAGAGIVADSQHAQEWQELEEKLQPFLQQQQHPTPASRFDEPSQP